MRKFKLNLFVELLNQIWFIELDQIIFHKIKCYHIYDIQCKKTEHNKKHGKIVRVLA